MTKYTPATGGPPGLTRRPRATEAVNQRDNLRDHAKQFRRYLPPDRHDPVQRPRHWRPFQHRDVVPAGDLGDVPGDKAGALGDDDRRAARPGLVLQGDGDVRRVGDDDRGPRHRLQHPLAGALALQPADALADERVALFTLQLLLDLLLAHADRRLE